MFKQGCALRKMEGSPVVSTCKIKDAENMICIKRVRFRHHLRPKGKPQG